MLVFLPDKGTGRGRWFVVDDNYFMADHILNNLDLYAEQISFEDIFNYECL